MSIVTLPAFASAPASLSMHQSQLFTRKALVVYPQIQRTVDSMGEVEADDNHRYYIKGDTNGTPVRASEWICSRISEAVGIGTPTSSPIELSDGSTVFGSRRIAGVADTMATVAYLTMSTASNAGVAVGGLRTILAAIYALDMFINNEDRHFGNYLSVDDNGTRRLYAFDFSRALFWSWPWKGFPGPQMHTRKRGVQLRLLHGFDEQAACTTLDRLGTLPTGTIISFINDMPADWLAPTRRDEFVHWWDSTERATRLANLRKGIVDGTLL